MKIKMDDFVIICHNKLLVSRIWSIKIHLKKTHISDSLIWNNANAEGKK